MSHPPETPDPRTPPGAPEEEGGLAHELHELQHGIEEVVEHIPEPVRWTVSRIVWLVLLGLFGLFVLVAVTAGLYLANRTEWVAQEIALLVNQTLALRSDVVLELRDIRGNPLTGFTAVEPRVRFRDGSGPPLLEARSFRLSYPLWGLARGGRGPIHIEVDQPTVRLTTGADGKLRLPRWRTAPSVRKRAPRGMDLVLDLTRGTLVAPAPIGSIEGLELGATVGTGAETRVDVRRLRWARGPWGGRLDALEGEMVSGDSVKVVLRRLQSPDAELSGRAAWSARGGEKLVHAEVRRVRWAWLAKVFDNGAFDVPGEGSAAVDLRGERTWSGDFTSDLTWNGAHAVGSGHFTNDGPRWRVEPLRAHSDAGDLVGHFYYSKDDWEVGGDVKRSDPSTWKAINVPNWPEGEVQGRFRYAVETRTRSSRLDAVLGPSILAGWRADSTRVWLDFPGGAGSDTFTVHARRRGGTLQLLAAVTKDGWRGTYRVTDLPLEEWPDGRASGLRGTLDQGAGTVESRGGELRVTGALDGHESDWLGAHLHRWRLDDVSGRLLPTPDLLAGARMRDAMYLGIHFDSLAMALHLGDAAVRLDGVRGFAGDTVIALAGDARWSADGWSARFDSAAVSSSQLAWVADPPLELSGNAREVRFDRLVARDHDATLEVSGQWASPGGTYDATIEATQLDLSRIGMPPDMGLGGRADARLRVTGVSGDPRWSFEGRVRGPRSMGHRGDSLYVAVGGSRGRLMLERGRFEYHGGSLEARGEAHGMQDWPDTLSDRGVLAWVATASAWSGEAHAREMPLDDVSRLASQAKGVRGELTGDVTWSGRPTAPEFVVHAVATPVAYGDFEFDRLSLGANYRGEVLDVQSLRIARGDVAASASGRMPMRLRLDRMPELPEQPMAWQVDMPNGDLSLLPAFLPQIGAASGRMEASARVRGTPQHPDLQGYARVRNGVVRLAARDEVLERVTADCSFDGATLTLDSLSAQQGKRGRVSARGTVDLAGLALHGYRFDVTARDFAAAETGVYAAVFDGDFVITRGPQVRGQSLPQVDGQVDVHRATVLYDFTKQSENDQLAASTQPLYWTYRLEVIANDNLRWQPPDADLELSCDLTVEQTRDSLIIFGDMNALRGSYYFLSNRFNVTQADLTFDNLNGVNPEITASATTRVVPASDPADDTPSAPHTITVDITGRAKEPEIKFTSDPDDWDESRILREITVGTVLPSNGSVNLADPLDSYLSRAINRQLSSELSRTFKGYLNDWALEREGGGLITGEGGLIVSVSTQPMRNVNVRYRQRLPGAARDYTTSSTTENPLERSVEAEYRLSRFIYVTSELTQRRTITGASSNPSGAPDFNVNLKARWEY